jgi:hypothetical protein
MSNLNTTGSTSSGSTSSTLTSSTSSIWYGVPCAIHGFQGCGCNANTGVPLQQQFQCPSCGMWYAGSNVHSCFGTGTRGTGFTWCNMCLQSHPAGIHRCPAMPYTTGNTSTLITGTNNVGFYFKEVKEITTDNELTYEWNGVSFDIRLPQKFSDCFLKVGYGWVPLYPLIFSAFEGDSKEMSFHLVTAILDKVFEGDNVILKSVTSIKIEDNLTLLQLTNRTKEYFQEDDKTSSAL